MSARLTRRSGSCQALKSQECLERRRSPVIGGNPRDLVEIAGEVRRHGLVPPTGHHRARSVLIALANAV
jgi:hypothetical protein